MGRRLALVGLGIVIAVAVYFLVLRRGPEAPDDQHATAHEQKVRPGVTPAPPVSDQERLGRELVAALALAPGQGFPTSLPWDPLHHIGARGGFPLENLLHARPVDFLQLCLDRYDREVHSYTCTFVKKERIAGKLYPPEKDQYEVIHVAFREEPFSVFFDWVAKPKLASRVLYVEGQNDDKMLARPFVRLLPVMTRAVDSPDAKSSGRYTIAEFGLGKAMRRTVKAMRAAEARGALHLRYEGKVKLAEVGERECYKFVRTPYAPPEDEGVNELTVYVDCETGLQVGSILRDADGRLIAEYFFRDIVLNPDIPDKQFSRAAL